jgi:hypothetical protein
MECLINLLAVCLFDPGNVYVTAGLEYQTNQLRDQQMLRPCWGTLWCSQPAYSGPIGSLTLGVTIELGKAWAVDYGFMHRSYTSTSEDRGLEFAFAEVTWRPFR